MPPPPRGVYLLRQSADDRLPVPPGFHAIVAAIDAAKPGNGNFQPGGIAVFIAMIFGGLDGRIARLTRTENAFGKEYDSLADMVSFGLAPAIVTYR